MEATQYFPVFITICALLCMGYSFQFLGSGNSAITRKGNQSMLFPFVVCTVFVFFVGSRPPFALAFGDSMSYTIQYYTMFADGSEVEYQGEWLLYYLMSICFHMGLTINDFFTIVAAIYTFTLLYALKILTPHNIMVALLFCFASFSFFTFSTNGIRNGMGCHMFILALALYLSDKKALGIALALLAFSTHRSLILPIGGVIAALYVIKEPKYAVLIWCGCVALSLVTGEFFVNLISALGFDERVEQYSTGDVAEEMGGRFRWDFLLYSALPVAMGWYLCVKQNITDNWYRVIFITYTLCNAFWVLIIRIAFTNRFAYMSWFLYPLVVVYPLVNWLIWPDHDQKTGTILLGYIFMTLAISYMSGML